MYSACALTMLAVIYDALLVWLGQCPPTFSSHSRISLLTQMSRTLGSSYVSSCRRPFRSRCSIAATSRGVAAAACHLNVYRTNRRNLSRVESGLVFTMRKALFKILSNSRASARARTDLTVCTVRALPSEDQIAEP